MKKLFLTSLVATFIFISSAITTYAQTRVYVKVRPTAVVVAKPAAPHAHYIWIGDEWEVKQGTYVHVAGHWVEPRKGYVWVPGHWATEQKGDYWVPEHWRKI